MIQAPGQDNMKWKKLSDGTFSVKSAYNFLAQNEPCPMKHTWRVIWRWKGPERVKSFLWLVVHDKILTNKHRVERHVDDTDLCPRCGKESETSLHAFRDCELVSNIWRQLIKPNFWNDFFSADLDRWVIFNLKSDLSRLKDGNWSLVFGLACRLFWLH